MSQTFAQFVPANAHGFLGAAAAAAPWYPVNSIDIRNALVILLAFVVLVAVIAVVVHKAHQPVSIVPKALDPATGHELEKQLRGPAQSTDSQMLQTLEQAIEQGVTNLDFDVTSSPNQPSVNQQEKIAAQSTEALKADSPAATHRAGPAATTHVSLPRLSELRGMRFTQAIRELDIARRQASPSNDNEKLMSAIAPFESMFSLTESPQAQNGDSPEASFADLEPLDAMRAFLPVSEQSVLPEAEEGVANGTTGGKRNPMHSKYFPPRPATPVRSTGGRSEENERSRPEQNAPRQNPGGIFDQLQILPSRHGQYNKKKS
jgi:hypothetical protein